MSAYRYQFEKGSKKHQCPLCGKKRFVRYVDQQTGSYLPNQYGRCDREINCGYFLNPYGNGFACDNGTDWRETSYQPPEPPLTDYIPDEVFSASLKGYAGNRFVSFLKTLFDDETVAKLIDTYCIGSSKHWEGSTVFWQLDQQGNIRSGKVMLYNATGHRVKEPFNHIHWVHALMYDAFNLEQCLFGEHLLTDDKSKPVAIVESEKTAIISSVYFPEFTWLAAGSLNNLKTGKCKALMGRFVTLFPDLGAFDKWNSKAEEISYFCNVDVSDLLENHTDALSKREGYDLADYLIQFDINEFGASQYPSPPKDRSLERKFKKWESANINKKGYPAEWDEIQVKTETQAYKEATRIALQDCDTDVERLLLKDPIIRKLSTLFDGKVPEKSVILN